MLNIYGMSKKTMILSQDLTIFNYIFITLHTFKYKNLEI